MNIGNYVAQPIIFSNILKIILLKHCCSPVFAINVIDIYFVMYIVVTPTIGSWNFLHHSFSYGNN